MTAHEIGRVMEQKIPVKHKGIIYSYIRGRLMRIEKGRRVFYAELMDKCGHSVTIARAKDVKLI